MAYLASKNERKGNMVRSKHVEKCSPNGQGRFSVTVAVSCLLVEAPVIVEREIPTT